MDDLFRFFVLRPASLPNTTEVRSLQPGFVAAGAPLATAQTAAIAFVQSGQAVARVDDLMHGGAAVAVAEALAGGARPSTEVNKLVKEVSGKSTKDLTETDTFKADVNRLENTLTAAKLVSGSPSIDSRGLATAYAGYDAIARATSGDSTIGLRPIAMPTFVSSKSPDGIESSQAKEPPDDRHSEPTDTAVPVSGRFEAAMNALSRLPVSSFDTQPDQPLGSEKAVRLNRLVEPRDRHDEPSSPEARAGASVSRPWRLSSQMVAAIPEYVKTAAVSIGVDLHETALPAIIEAFHSAHLEEVQRVNAEHSKDYEEFLDRATRIEKGTRVPIGTSLEPARGAESIVGAPTAPMPAGHGTARPVGIGDLLMVKQHSLRYEGGELAHVENVLKSEHLGRETRRLERVETIEFDETEKSKEDERDTQSTDRFSLKRETNETIKSDSEFKAGVSVDAKYGSFVEVKANADVATKNSSEEATRQATEFSKDVVARSVSKVIERVLQRRTVTTLNEFEEKYSHGFDNTNGSGNISGVYQWVDKLVQSQVYNYGKRMLFDITLPEPSTEFILAQGRRDSADAPLIKPDPFILRSDELDESNYTEYAAMYGATGIEAPPSPVKTYSKAFDAIMPQDPYEGSKSLELQIDDGYQAKYALIQRAWTAYANPYLTVMIGNRYCNAIGEDSYFDMSGEVGSVPVAYYAYGVRGFAVTIEIFCERTERAMTAWKLKAHAAITGAYKARLQAYESEVAEAAAAAGVTISGRNPLWNLRIITTELRKQCITMLTGQQFDSFGALEVSATGDAQVSLARVDAQMPFIRFFEQAFEWEHMVYSFYPYFWGWKPAWHNRMLLDDVDSTFADFLRAGAGRVVFPVRPGFEAAVIHYLETGQIWDGGPPPDISSSMYIPIVKEIQEAQGAPGGEVAVGDPWLVRLPTTLVKLRADDALPAWSKVGEAWQPVN